MDGASRSEGAGTGSQVAVCRRQTLCRHPFDFERICNFCESRQTVLRRIGQDQNLRSAAHKLDRLALVDVAPAEDLKYVVRQHSGNAASLAANEIGTAGDQGQHEDQAANRRRPGVRPRA